jgi:hypothetical protein
MRRLSAVLAVGLGPLLTRPLAASARVPDGVIELSAGSVVAGIGFSWGRGTP